MNQSSTIKTRRKTTRSLWENSKSNQQASKGKWARFSKIQNIANRASCLRGIPRLKINKYLKLRILSGQKYGVMLGGQPSLASQFLLNKLVERGNSKCILWGIQPARFLLQIFCATLKRVLSIMHLPNLLAKH